MEKFLKKRWYLTLFLIPILVNVFTGIIDWGTLFRNKDAFVCLISVSANLILSIEFFRYYLANRSIDSKIERDKALLIELLSLLNLEKNEEILKHTTHDEDFDFDYVISFKDFIKRYKKLDFVISDKQISDVLEKLVSDVVNYVELIGSYMESKYENGKKIVSVVRDLKYKNESIYYERLKKLDASADRVEEQIKSLMKVMTEKGIM